MLSPADSLTAPERLLEARLVRPHGSDDIERGRQESGAIFGCEDPEGPRRQAERCALRIVQEVARSALLMQPFTRVALANRSVLGELSRRERTMRSECLVQPELVAEAHHHRSYRRRQIIHHTFGEALGVGNDG